MPGIFIYNRMYMKLIKNVSQNWKKMDGSNNLVKKINAYLCSSYISGIECPSDECLSYAERFAILSDNAAAKEEIKSVLIEYFWTATDLTGKVVQLKQPKGILEKNVNDIMEMIKSEKN